MMKAFCLGAIAVTGLVAVVRPAIAEPFCYMVDSAGRMQNLTGMCGNSGKESAAKATGTTLATVSDESTGDLIQVGTARDGSPIFYDKKSLTPKTFALEMETKGNFFKFDFEYACSERRVFESKTTVYKPGQKPVILKSDDEFKFIEGSPASKGLQLACKQSKAPGY